MAAPQYIDMQEAAERALASMAMRALLARAQADRHDVDSLSFLCTVDSPGLVVVECTVHVSGAAVEGYSL